MKKYLTHIIFFILLVNNNIFANKDTLDIQVSDSFEYANISSAVKVYCDTTLVLGIDQIINQREQSDFSINKKEYVHVGIVKGIYWIEFVLSNTASSSVELLLEIADPDIHECQLFIVREEGIEKSILTGDIYKFDQRPIKHRYFLFPISLSEGEKVKCYFKADKHFQSLNLAPQLWSKKKFLEEDSHQSLGFAIFIGFVLAYLCIILLLILFFKSKTLVYYFFFVLTALLLVLNREGFSYQFFWADLNNEVYAVVRGTWQGIQLLFFLLMSVSFFSTRTQGKIDLTILSGMKNIFLVLLPAVFILVYFIQSTSYVKTLLAVSTVSILASIGYVLILSYREYFKNNDYETLGLGSVMLVHLMMTLSAAVSLFYKVDLGIDTITIVYCMVLLFEILVMSIVLFSKYWNLHQEKQRLELGNSQNELSIANALLKGQEQERLRIANDLQKNLYPLLNQANLFFQEKIKPEKDSILSQNIMEHLNQSKLEVDRIVNNLVPDFLFENDLMFAIQRLCDKINDASGFSIDLNYKSITHTFSATQKINIYRIIQELLNNVVKHAQASQVQVVLEQIDNQLVICIEDDGVGIKKETQGFNTLKTRTERMNGNITFTKSSKSGLKVKINIQLK